MHASYPPVPVVEPQRIAPDTFLIPNLVAAQPGTYVFVNSMVILAEQPVVVDTGAPLFRERWLDAVASVVDPADVRWVFLSHDDGDHIGNMADILASPPTRRWSRTSSATSGSASTVPARCPSSARCGSRRAAPSTPATAGCTCSARRSSTGRRPAACTTSAPARCGRSTRSPRLTTGAVYDAVDLPPDLYDGSFQLFNSLVSPWHQWLDPVRYSRHVDTVEAIAPTTIASAHGPVLRGAVHRRRLRPGAGHGRRAERAAARPGDPRRPRGAGPGGLGGMNRVVR